MLQRKKEVHKPQDLVAVAQVGRAYGVKGEVVLHILSDFPESIKSGNTYFSKFGDLTLLSYCPIKSIAKFAQIHSREEVQQITNLTLYTTQEATKEQCELKEGEFFWFDIIGSEVIENSEILGRVFAIDRFCGNDYLMIETSSNLTEQNLPKSFLIPYIERYILEVESTRNPKAIHTRFCKEILENS